MPFLNHIPTSKDLTQAYERINSFIHRTPVVSSELINKIVGCEIYFKCENFQKGGAFKFRGAVNAVLSLSDEEALRGVITHSSGNHAAALAKAASIRNISAVIVMPENAPQIKRNAVKSYGAEIIYCKPTIQSREETAHRIIEERGLTLVHPFNNYTVIAGQSTASRELLDEVKDIEFVLAPVGGGGLASGTSLTVNYFHNGIKAIGAEPSGADDAFRSLRGNKLYPQDNPQTICDGLRTPLSEKTFGILREHLHSVIPVEDNLTITAMRLIMERMKIVIEPSSAVVLAAVLKEKEFFKGKKIGLILSGGNVDLTALPFGN